MTELEKWEEGFPIHGNPTAQRNALANGIQLLEGAINALNEKYQRGMGPLANIGDLLTPAAKQTLARIQGMGATPQGGGNAPPAAIQYLRAHPEMAPAFKAKYGYLPGG